MKKVLVILLSISLMVSVTACTSASSNNASTTPATATTAATAITATTSASSTAQPTEVTSPTATNVSASVVSPAGELPIVKEPVTLTCLSIIDEFVQDITTNTCTQWVEGQTNVKIVWQQTTGADAAQKINLVLASNSELPDIMLRHGLSTQQINAYGEQGMFLPLNDLNEKYGFNFKKAVQKAPAIWNDMVSSDGKLYAMGAYEECEHCKYSQKMWINQTWLTNLGLAMPKTTAEFESVLKAFKEKDPNKNGKKDEVPMASCINQWNSVVYDNLLNAFVYNNGGDRLDVSNGKVSPVYNTPAFREGLKYVNSLWKQGLIDNESLTQPVEQIQKMVMGDVITLARVSTADPS